MKPLKCIFRSTMDAAWQDGFVLAFLVPTKPDHTLDIVVCDLMGKITCVDQRDCFIVPEELRR